MIRLLLSLVGFKWTCECYFKSRGTHPVNRIALFTVNSSHLHYNIFAPGCEAISGKKCKIPRNCLTSKFKNIVMQMRKGNREKGY